MADHVTCKQCHKLYSDPVLLPCLHSLCNECSTSATDGQDAVTCPTCNEMSTVPQDGLPQDQGLARLVNEVLVKQKISTTSSTHCDSCEEATAVVYCSECSEFYCIYCRDYHKVSRKTKTHPLEEVGKSTNVSVTTKKPVQCIKHGDQVLKYYCKDCNVLVCSECALHGHKQHSTCDCEEVAEEGRGSIRNSMQGCPDIMTTLDDVIGNGKKMIESIKSRKKEVDREINDVFSELQKVLTERHTALLKECDDVSIAKVTAINIQLERVGRLKDQVSHARDVAGNTLESHQVSELLRVRKVIENRLNRLKREFKELSCDVARMMSSLPHWIMPCCWTMDQLGWASDTTILKKSYL